ncbi:MAG: polysaccharide deacetylase family protein [Firmicutes bacterium]|nr:polysaccharide deacetylase family protein [Bacillota bacterium]
MKNFKAVLFALSLLAVLFTVGCASKESAKDTNESNAEQKETITETLSETVTEETTTTTTETTTVSLVDPNKPMIALTFDDGPRINSTELIVDALQKVNGRATFFVVGSMVNKHPELVKMAVDAGCQIGNHSYDHLDLKSLSTNDILYQINTTSNLVYEASGVYPMIGRPPYGSVNNTVRNAVSIPWFNWNHDTLDWKYKDANQLYNEIMTNTDDGDVILMHDLHTSTAEAMVKAIPELAKTYQLVTIDEMAQAKGGYENVPGYIREN